jgi:hypothetical protein
MGIREDAYLKYLSVNNSNLTENNLSPDEIKQFQNMAGVGYANKGQLNYSDYQPGNDQFKHTVGRTGVGGIQRQGNNWIINDKYDFNDYHPGENKLAIAAQSLAKGKPLDALGTVSNIVGTPYNTNVRVPMTPEQIQQYGGKQQDATPIKLGGQDYDWELKDVSGTGSYQDIAKSAFAGNKYKAEGSNLDNMAQMIAKRNIGNTSNLAYVPKARQQENALSLLAKHLFG